VAFAANLMKERDFRRNPVGGVLFIIHVQVEVDHLYRSKVQS
jgi:hypothetical protein